MPELISPSIKIQNVTTISTKSIWSHHENNIYRSNHIGDIDSFYPIYKMGNNFSFSILPLVLLKRRIDLNKTFIEKYIDGGGDVAGPEMTIDTKINRLGAAPRLIQRETDRRKFVANMAFSMNADIREACDNNPNKTHLILCGGKDSLNILLANWSAPVIAYSAEPNYPLVARFVDENKLGFDVRRLEDSQPEDGLNREIAEAACLINLEHWKWTESLRVISKSMNQKVVFWKGQMADLMLTDYWRSYTSQNNKTFKIGKKFYKRAARIAPFIVDKLFFQFAIRDLERSIWQRGGVAQGAHLGFLRSICDALVLSAYHGPRTTSVMHSMDLKALTRDGDLRPEIGRALLGREVVYPTTNPAPSSSRFRQNLRSVNAFTSALANLGIEETSERSALDDD